MLISHSHKFVFFHSPKTGGSSFAHAMAPYLDDPVHVIEDDTHSGWQENHHVGPVHSQMSSYEEFLLEMKGWTVAAFIRSPWSRMVMIWHYGCWFLEKNRSYASSEELLTAQLPPDPDKDMSFGEFVRSWPHAGLDKYDFVKPQSGYLDRMNLLTFIGRFENYESEVDRFCRSVGIKTPQLPHRLKRKVTCSWQNHYNSDPDLIDLVGSIWKEDISQLNYKPPELTTW